MRSEPRKLSSFVFILVLFLLFILPARGASVVKSGSCGDNVGFTLDSDGVLVISGSGVMKNYSSVIFSRVPWYSYTSDILEVKIMPGVKSIGNSAFEDCDNLKSVTIAEGITSIGRSAFEDCRRLTSVMIPNGVTSIGNSAFDGCSGLESVMIPNSVTEIGSSAFYGCSHLTNITMPPGVTSIGAYVFSGCAGLTGLTIPDGVTSIGNYAFRGCTGLTGLTIPDGVTSIGTYAFQNCTGIKSVTIPQGVTDIGSCAFNGCTGLTDIKVAKGNQTYHAEGNCLIETESKTLLFGCNASLIPAHGSVTSIGEYAFDGCAGLRSVTIPSGVTSIGSYAFRNCTGLTDLTIPNGVTTIGSYALRNCTGLSRISIPNSVTSIGNGAFVECTGLSELTVAAGNGIYHSSGNCLIETGSKTLLFGSKNSVIPADGSVTSIGDYAFSYCSGLSGAAIPNSVKSIGSYAFYSCTALTGVTIPEGVTSIGTYAFRSCTGLIDAAIPRSVTSIGQSAFSNNGKFKYVYYSGNATEWDAIEIGTSNTDLTSALLHYNAVSHTWDAGTVTTAPTYTAPGEKTYRCTLENCDAVKTEAVPALPREALLGDNVTLYAASVEYNGKQRTPVVTVKNAAGVKLTAGKDYTVAVPAGRTVPGTYVYTVTGIGAYTGEVVKHFVVKPCTLKAENVTLYSASVEYNGKQRTPKVTVTSPWGVTLTQGTHYTVTVPAGRTVPGTYVYIITGTGRFTGTIEANFVIKPCTLKSENVTLYSASVEYNAKLRTPKVTVKSPWGVTLTEGTHYTVTVPEGRTVPGTYVYYITGKGRFTGTVNANFIIKPCTLKTENVSLYSACVIYNGKLRTPKVTVKSPWGVTLTEGTHYTVAVPAGRTFPGTYVYKVTGKGRFAGTVNADFVILEDIYPTAALSATNQIAGSQTVTLTMHDNDLLKGYYWGTDPDCTKNVFFDLSDYSVGDFTRSFTVTEPGVYYFTVENRSGYLSATKTVTFRRTTLNPNGGTVSPPVLLNRANVAISLPTPAFPGYRLQYWTDTAEGSHYSADYTPTADRILLASWEEYDNIPPTVTLSSTNDLVSKQTLTISIGDETDLACYYWGTNPDHMQNVRYTLGGLTALYKKQITAPGTYYVYVEDANGNHAETVITYYRTTLNANGGSVAPETILTPAGNSVQLPLPIRESYTFVSWEVPAPDLTAVTYAPVSDRTLSAVWNSVQSTTVSAPTGVETAVNADGSVSLNWEPVSNATKYSVFRASSANGSDIRIGEAFATAYTDHPGGGTVWYYKIKAEYEDSYVALQSPFSACVCTAETLSAANVTLYSATVEYNGKERTPTVTVKNAAGVKLISGRDYTVTIPAGRTVPGTYVYTITGIGAYTGTITKNFVIKPCTLKSDNVSLYSATVTYNGKQRTPKVTVTSPWGVTLTEGTHYTVKVPAGRTQPGIYVYMITGKGRFTGTVHTDFIIKPVS